MVASLEAGLAAKGATIDDFRHPDGVSGAFQNEFLIHLREGEPCRVCGTRGAQAARRRARDLRVRALPAAAAHEAPHSESLRLAPLVPPRGISYGEGMLRFARHYAEMLIAMFVGMFVLGGVLAGLLLLAGVDVGDWREDAPALLLLGMAFTMTVPMVAWMRYRGHGWAPAGDMALAMFVPSLVAIAPGRDDGHRRAAHGPAHADVPGDAGRDAAPPRRYV